MHLHHLALRTADPNILAAFYIEVLSLVVTRRRAHSIWLALGPVQLMIEQGAAGEPTIDPQSMDMFAVRIDESERAIIKGRLDRLGVAVENETEFTTYFRDPDGRRIGISSYTFEV